MAQRIKHQREDDGDLFYEAMPLSRHQLGTWDEAAEEAPDHDLEAIDETGRDMAIRTLVFVALATIVICLLLIWAVQAAQTVLPAAQGTVLPTGH